MTEPSTASLNPSVSGMSSSEPHGLAEAHSTLLNSRPNMNSPLMPDTSSQPMADAHNNSPITINEGKAASSSSSSSRGRGRGRKRGGSNVSPRELASDISPAAAAAPASISGDDGGSAPNSYNNNYEQQNGTPDEPQGGAAGVAGATTPGAAKRPRRRKVDHACIYCRRSHMTCDEGRPCSRCIRRNIGHLCRDEPKKKTTGSANKVTVKSEDSEQLLKQHQQHQHGNGPTSGTDWSSNTSTSPLEPTPASAHQPTAMVLTSQSQGGLYGQGSSLVFQELVDHRKSSENASNNGIHDKKTEAQHHPMQPPQNTGSLTVKPGGDPENINDLQTTTNGPQRSPFNDWSSLGNQSVLAQTSEFNQSLFYSEHANSEFASLGDFLTMIEDPNANPDLLLNHSLPSGLSSAGPLSANVSPGLSRKSSTTDLQKHGEMGGIGFDAHAVNNGITGSQSLMPVHGRVEPVVSDSARDKFFLTAADPSVDVSPEERLKQVIRAKVEAGLLQPFNYARGYARLQKYMDNYMNQSSKQRILKPLSIFRPAFRAIAQSLMDIDLVLVEEAFERMLLDYDRVFTSMAIPACLWRRTGEIYRGNKEFAGLVEVSVDDLRDGKLAIYELMSEESAVNYWEKYGNIAFDSGQKAVLTSCNLRTRDRRKRRACCFSFTVQRDRYNM